MPRYAILRPAIVLAVCGAWLFISCSRSDTPTSVTTVAEPSVDVRRNIASGGSPIVLAAGDLVCGTGTSSSAPCQHAAVAGLVGGIAPDAVLLLGDLQYENATLADFNTYFNASWGAHKSLIKPAAGNHEYNTSGAKGYYDYFNGVGVQTGAAGDRSKGYYSYNLGSWHVIAINSNCSAIGGCGSTSAQVAWLKADLAANPTVCTLAYWHHPRFSSGSHGNNSAMQTVWQVLYDAGADVVLAGHDHEYERFAPQTATGIADAAKGIRSFVVGTGGKEKEAFGTIRANSELRSNTSFGLLKLTLNDGAFDWAFQPIAGNTLSDAGSANCVGASAPPPPPPPPPTETTLTLNATADAHVMTQSKNTNYGSATTLLVDGSPTARTYMRFSVTGIGSKSVVSAKLRLYAVDPSDAGGRLHVVSNTTWSESTITSKNAPSYTSAIVGSLGAVVSGQWYEIDVTSAITTDRAYSFALESTSSNGADYVSRQGSSGNGPQLVIVVR